MTSLSQLAANPRSQDVTQPLCPHFGPCGGCQLQHLLYSTQLERKAALLRSLLAPVVPALPELRLHASPPFGYRNRIRLTLAHLATQLRAGYLQAAAPGGEPFGGPDSMDEEQTGQEHGERARAVPGDRTTFLPIAECPIAAPVLWRAVEAFLDLARRSAGAWLRDRHTPDQLELFTNADQSQLTFTIFLRTTSRTLPSQIVEAFAAFCNQLHKDVPELAGAGISLLPSSARPRSRRGEAPRPGAAWGAAGLNYAIPDLNRTTSSDPAAPLSYWVPRTAFFQVNRFLLPELVELATVQAEHSPGHSLAWDLYAGAGLFTRPLARSFAQVTAVEIAEAAYTALARTKLDPVTAVQATTLDFLRGAVLQRERPDLVLLDPPRTGAGPEVCRLLGRIAPPRLLYISCAPNQLAADLAVLTSEGYRVTELHLFDLFPQTVHIEAAAVLSRE